VLRRKFGPKRDEIIGRWNKFHNEELHNFSAPNIVRMIKSRRTRWARHLARTRAKKNACTVLVGKPERKTALRRTYPGRRTILKWVLEKQDGVIWTGLICLRIGTNGGIL
jgi:hypothetical protein